jgi:NADPH-dependent curcumin reductase CurA
LSGRPYVKAAKAFNLRVAGSSGSDDRVVNLLNELKLDTAFDFEGTTIHENLKCAAPEGIAIFYEKIGCETLEAVLEVTSIKGCIFACRMILQYKPPRCLAKGVEYRLVNKDVVYKENVAEVIEASETFIGMFILLIFGKEGRGSLSFVHAEIPIFPFLYFKANT